MKIKTKADKITSAETAADSEQKDEYLFVSQHSSKPNVIGRVFCLLGKHDWSGSNENICQRCGKIAVGLPKFENPPPPPVKTIYCPLAEEGEAEEVLDK